MRDYPMTDVIAEREYDFVGGEGKEVIRVQVGKPAPAPDAGRGGWYCPWIIRRADHTRRSSAAGEDGLQALMLSLSGLRADLRQIAATGKLTLLDGLEGPFIELTAS